MGAASTNRAVQDGTPKIKAMRSASSARWRTSPSRARALASDTAGTRLVARATVTTLGNWAKVKAMPKWPRPSRIAAGPKPAACRRRGTSKLSASCITGQRMVATTAGTARAMRRAARLPTDSGRAGAAPFSSARSRRPGPR